MGCENAWDRELGFLELIKRINEANGGDHSSKELLNGQNGVPKIASHSNRFKPNLGNQFTAILNFLIPTLRKSGVNLAGAAYFQFFTLLMLVTAVVFIFVARRYRGNTYIQAKNRLKCRLNFLVIALSMTPTD